MMTIRRVRPKTMEITNFYVQHILKAYSQQLSNRARISKEKTKAVPVQRDQVTLSEESKKKMVADKVVQQLVTQLTRQQERNETALEILNRLSQEYGHRLDVSADDEGAIVFKVLEETPEKIRSLPPEENENLKSRLLEVTRSIVYDHLLE
ncbi:MAG: DVU0524 family FlgM-associated protein [Thermodesulfobacteriota bacterium]